MFKYGQMRNFKTKYAHIKNKRDISNYTKMYNLELESLNPNTFLKLQNRIGNKATQELLRQLSMTEITENISNNNEIRLSASSGKAYNKSNLANAEIDKNLKVLADNHSNRTSDILKRRMLYKDNREGGRLTVDAESIYFIIHKLDELSTILRKNSFITENKELEIKNSDKMLDLKEKTSVSDVEFILDMISKLHKYDENEETVQDYMKTINLLANTGVNLIEFLGNNNNINEQKRMLYQAFGATKAAKSE